MKLISCYIENFGKIKQKSIYFQEGTTNICENNGYGKSTLASFLKAMFYGMDSTRKNSKFNDRAHYFPFDKGNFGGNVVFSYQGKNYKIERTFDETSDTRDTMSVYCNGIPYRGFVGSIGEYIFGIDKESFEKTIFITSHDVELSSTDSINTKLNNFVEGSNDDTNLQSALDRLEKRKKEYKKSRLSSGLIQSESEQVNEIKDKIANYNTIRAGLTAKYIKLNDYEKRVEELTVSIATAQSENVVRTNWEHYDGILLAVSDCEKKIMDIQKKYPFGMPSADDVDKVLSYLATLDKGNALSKKKIFTDEDAKKYDELQGKFSDGFPIQEELTEMQNSIEELQTLTIEIKNLQEKNPTEEETVLKHRFSAHIPSEKDILTLTNNYQQYKDADNAYNVIPDYLVTKSADPNNVKVPSFGKLNISLAVFSAAILIAGIILMFFQFVTGIILLIVSFVTLVVDGFLYLNNKSSIVAKGSITQTENPEKTFKRNEIAQIAMRIGALLMPYGYTLSDGVSYAVATFLNDWEKYKTFKKEYSKKAEVLALKCKKISGIRRDLDAFFKQYKIKGEDYIMCFSKLQTDISDFQTLQNRKIVSDNADIVTCKNMEEATNGILLFCQKYKIEEDVIAKRIFNIQEDIKDFAIEKHHLEIRKNEAENFRKNKRLMERPSDEMVDLTEMNNQLTQMQEEKGKIALEIADDERDLEQSDALQNELIEREERLNTYKFNFLILQKTEEMLEIADVKLKEKYIRPIRDSFKNYSAVIEKALGENVVMDANFNVRFEHNGIERSEEHLSSGQKSICAFCFRMALIDNMYSEEKPFLILDDPFVNLDKKNLEKVKQVIVELSKKLQIVYFSCHDSRNII